MLRQDVNLYRSLEIKKPAALFLTWGRLKQCALLFAALLMIIYLILFTNYYLSRQQVNRLAMKETSLHREVMSLKESFPQLFFSQDVGETVDKLKNDIEGQRKILNSLITMSSFSEILQMLSATIIPDVWLTKITVMENGNKITLDGNSSDITEIQQFADNLRRHAVSKIYDIDISNIEESTNIKSPSKLNFIISMTKNDE